MPSRCNVECLLACAHTAIGARLQCCMRTTHGTSGVLSGPLTGSLLHSLNVNLGALEKSEKARNLIFVCRALSAKASLPAVAPRRPAFQWHDRALAHGAPGGRRAGGPLPLGWARSLVVCSVSCKAVRSSRSARGAAVPDVLASVTDVAWFCLPCSFLSMCVSLPFVAFPWRC